MRALLVSIYDLGHQPFGLASPAAWLAREGVEVRCADLAKEQLAEEDVRNADLIGFHLPMHTATRLAEGVIRKARHLNSRARICAYGLYAPPNEDWLRSLGVNDVLGGEFEADLTALARSARITARPSDDETHARSGRLARLTFLKPDRSSLPPLQSYAALHLTDGSTRVVGYTEASRGCRHLCRHCPVVPIYEGQFRIVQPDVVSADIEAQVAAGAQHITFGDPDFFNGPTHAMRVVEALHAAHRDLTYDVTIKVEHLLKHRSLLPRLAETGCLFVTSAVESLDDRVLEILAKHHTRRDFLDVVAVCGASALTLVPTFVAFHPWLTLRDYCELIDTLADLDLVDHVPPVQLAIRLLIPGGSRLLELGEVSRMVGPFDPHTLAYPWSHPDARVDALYAEVAEIVGSGLRADRRIVFEEISALAHERAGAPRRAPLVVNGRHRIPYVDEPWYCCAEPNPEQLRLV